VRDFSYPSNTVNPVDGSVASALSWSIAERADKDRFFAEPGFIVGITTARPKVYLGNQAGAVSGFLNNAYSWLPALLQDDPYTSLRKFTANNGPLAVPTDYWVDLRDLFMHGDQFVNVEMTPANLNVVTLPREANVADEIKLITDYASDADIEALFASTELTNIRVDGRVDFSILSRITDTTP